MCKSTIPITRDNSYRQHKKTLSNIANIALLCNLLHNDNDNDKLGEGKVAH